MQHKLLCDLSLGYKSFGYSGIPQDARLLFNGLSKSQNIDVSGLIFGSNSEIFKLQTGDKQEETAVFFGSYLEGKLASIDNSLLVYVLRKFAPSVANIISRYRKNKVSQFDLKLISSEFLEMVWRNIFYQTIKASDKANILKNHFYWSRMSLGRIACGTEGKLPTCELATDGFDFALFQDSRYVKLSPQTTRIIRYHDGIPCFHSDTANNQHHTLLHIKGIKACAKDSIFVCNSSASLDDLSKISPMAASKASVIPYFLPKMEKQNTTYKVLENICALRRSESTLPEKKDVEINLWFKGEKKIPKFIMSLATIEPRKNFIGLINAWSKIRYQTEDDIKLMIVGKPGWSFKPTLKMMRPFVKSGDLMHLEGVAQHELPYLYSAASCFVFPSFVEGFGLPPNEAMQCDCPVALSNIAAHRYSAGNAALYFDPYDIDDMAHQLKKLLDTDSNAAMIDDLIDKGRANVERYSHETVLPQWEGLFDELKAKKNQLQR